MSQYYEELRRRLLITILSRAPLDPIREICVDEVTSDLKEYDKKRVGRPRHNWWREGISKYWEFLNKSKYPRFENVEYDGTNPSHFAALQEAISHQYGL